MYFHKIDSPLNFRFPGLDRAEMVINPLGRGVFHLTVEGGKWTETGSFAPFFEKAFQGGNSDITLKENEGGISLKRGEKVLLSSKAEKGFGVSGRKWMFVFDYSDDMLFYGMGEKSNGFEKSGIKTKFWNTDVWGDFPVSQVVHDQTDPMYLSVPYLLIKRDHDWIGILMDNPYAAFMATGAGERIANQKSVHMTYDFYMGSTEGKPSLYFIHGQSAGEVTGKLQKLCGLVERPPLWSLGYHQCRWGYESYEDLKELDEKFAEHEIPCDGLWLDIDYMDGFRVFSWNDNNFSDPAAQIAEITKNNRQVVPILDPGVKFDQNFPIYKDGHEKGIFCLNSEGFEYRGFVWPGETIFPDFSLEEGKEWWAENVSRFAALGMKGVWIDMNDPSTGSSELNEMKFQRGEKEHEFFHNQYSLGMQEATYRGLRKANPGNRPFILSRSGFTGTSRWSAIWTGDNFSNYHNLEKNLETALNLSISSIPFIGADVPGFGGDATEELMLSWHKAAFLSPVLRNHSLKDTRRQEPWAFNDKVLKIVKHYIRLRYKLLPFLYNLFIEQEKSGEPLIRPLFYHGQKGEMEKMTHIADQFFMGENLMQAPLVKEGQSERNLYLPQGRWYDVNRAAFIEGGGDISFVDSDEEKTPIFLRDGSVVPMLKGERKDNHSDLSQIEIHLFGDSKSVFTPYEYTFDKGDGYGYEKGEESTLKISPVVEDDKLIIEVESLKSGFGECHMQFVLYGSFRNVTLLFNGGKRSLSCKDHKWTFAFSEQECQITDEVII